MATVPLFSPALITAPASECRAPTVPGHPRAVAAKHSPSPPNANWRGVSVKAKVPQVLGLPLYHISRHMVGTFKACHSTTTPFDLSIFSSTQTGQTTKPLPWHQTNPRPSSL